MQKSPTLVSLWRRRDIRDAAAVAVIGVATYAAAGRLDLFDRLHALAEKSGFDVTGNAIVVAGLLGVLLPIYVFRRARERRRQAATNAADKAAQLTRAFSSISQGVLMFDAAERLVVCNDYYLKMYGLSADVIRPGAFFRDIIRHRMEIGILKRDAEEYRTELLTRFAQGQIVRAKSATPDGREIAITSYPMAGGGWVTTHEDQTDLLHREASFRLLFDNNPVPMFVFDRKTLRFLAVNDAALLQYGYSRPRFLTMKLLDIRVGEHDSGVKLLRAPPEDQNGEYVGQHRRADGTSFHVVVHSRILRFADCEARLAAIHDVTERLTIEHDLRRTKTFLDAVIENVPQPIIVKTVKDGRLTLINKASEELHGYRREDIIGKTLYDILPKDRADVIMAQDALCTLFGRPIVSGDHLIPTARGDRVINSKKVVIPGDDGAPEHLLTLVDDVTERREVEHRIAHMAHSDPLTDLPNRTAFNKYLSKTLERAKEESRSFAVLCMDLNGFKKVNDVYGHAGGDALLCAIAERLRSAAGDVFVARLGGDEFTIVAANDDRKQVHKLIDRLLAAFVDDFEIEGHILSQALSIGVALYPEHGTDGKTLMKNADAALYQAKVNEAGSVRFFEATLDAKMRECTALQIDLSTAIGQHEMRLQYQPQLRMTGEVTGMEALVRWHSPKRGVVAPSDFIPLAEKSSIILDLGKWVLREACREAASWPEPLTIAVNVSPVQFRLGDLARLVHLVLIETGLSPGRLELEITEGVLIDDFSRAVSILRRLKSLGVKIVLDDFGTGYSSLSYLRAFPFDKIKIDRSFISDVESNRHSVAIVRAVIGLGRSLDIPILAEGVETAAQHAFLLREGCGQVQGFLTGRPEAIADYAKVVGRPVPAAALVRAG